MEKEKFLKSFLVIGSGSIINLLLGLFTTPIITRMVDPTEYGMYSLFNTYNGIALIILCLGLDQALVRFYYDDNSKCYKQGLLKKCVCLPLLLCVCFGILIVVFTQITNITLGFGRTIIVLFAVYTFLSVFYRFSQLVVRLEFDSKLYSKLNVLAKLSYLIFVFPFLYWFDGNDLLALCLAITAATLVCLVISVVAERNLWFGIFKSEENLNNFRTLFKYGWPYIITLGVTSFFQAIDKMSLSYFCDYETVGVYSSAMSIVSIFGIIRTTFNALWAPAGVEHYKSNPDDKTFYQKGNQYITVIMFLIGIVIIGTKDIFVLLLGEKYRDASYIIPCLIFSPIMDTISETTVGGLVYKKKSQYQIIVAVIACIVNLVGNTILIPILGSRGAAISTGISYIIFFSARTLLANRFYYVDFKLKNFYTLTACVLVYAIYSSFVAFSIKNLIGFAVCVILVLVLYRNAIREMICYVINEIGITCRKK